MRYSTFESLYNEQATLVEESWADFVQRMSKWVVATKKDRVGLFSGTTFGGTGNRGNVTAESVEMLILDFDNSEPVRGADGKPLKDENGKTVKRCVATPTEWELIESLLEGYTYVLATSFSHTPEWPRFRVVLPLAEPVSARQWFAVAPKILASLGLDSFLDTLDRCYSSAANVYYWPAHKPKAEHYFNRADGIAVPVEIDEVIIAETKRRESKNTSSDRPQFTQEQVSRFYAAEFPELDQFDELNGHGEWCVPCILHGGTKRKLHINQETGLWLCFSECSKGGADYQNGAGDLYKFYMKKHDVEFKVAREAVHTLIGEPGAEYSVDELEAIIEVSEPEEVDDLVTQIAYHPTKARKALVQQLVTRHQLIPENIDQAVKEARRALRGDKIVEFPESAKARARGDASTEFSDELSTQREKFGLDLEADRFQIDERGVYKMRLVGKPSNQAFARDEEPVAERPIWPLELGEDLATDSIWANLAWHGSRGQHYSQWLPATALNSPDALVKLNDAPVATDNASRVCAFLRYAKTRLLSDTRTITSQIGWFGPENKERFILPGLEESLQYVGIEFPMTSGSDEWLKPVVEILGLGRRGYTALTVIALSAAAPLVRLIGKRNPIIALAHHSGSGKGTVIEYAVSLWSEPKALTVSADSTGKGTQDKAIFRPDLPIFIDEVQQLAKKDLRVLEAILYFYGNGVQRTVSSRTQEARGGARRYGVSFMAAENTLLGQLQRGAQNRVIELAEPPLPPSHRTLTNAIQRATQRNYGALAPAIAKHLNENAILHLAMVEDLAMRLSDEEEALQGDDPYTIALAVEGLRILEEVTGIKMPDVQLQAWLTQYLLENRLGTRDADTSLLCDLLDKLVSATIWDASNGHNLIATNEGIAALRRELCIDAGEAPLEVIATHPFFDDLFRGKGSPDVLASTWKRSGWMFPQGRNLKWTRPTNLPVAPGARVWRFTPEALALIGLDAEFEPIKQE